MQTPPTPRGPPRPHARRIALLVAVATVTVLAVLWSVTPLARIADAGAIDRYRAVMRAWPLAPFAVVGAYVVLGFVAAPATLMIGATLLLLGPREGAACAFAGMLANAIATYGLMRAAARDLVDGWLARRSGSKLDALNRLLARRGFVAIVLMRLTPTPYTLQNVVAGAARIGGIAFVAGTAIGIIPVIALMAGVTTGLDAWRTAEGSGDLLLASALVGFAAVVIAVARHAARRRRPR